jgi:hypothetical protein
MPAAIASELAPKLDVPVFGTSPHRTIHQIKRHGRRATHPA